MKIMGRPPKAPREIMDQSIRWMVENNDPKVPRRANEFKAWKSQSPLHRKVYMWMKQMERSSRHMGRKTNWLAGDVVPLPVHWEQSGSRREGIRVTVGPRLTEFPNLVTCVT